jgi:hypothetical protein
VRHQAVADDRVFVVAKGRDDRRCHRCSFVCFCFALCFYVLLFWIARLCQRGEESALVGLVGPEATRLVSFTLPLLEGEKTTTEVELWFAEEENRRRRLHSLTTDSSLFLSFSLLLLPRRPSSTLLEPLLSALAEAS